ncbi:aminomethyltransferase family protein [Leisingera daeponensis]|uniref:Aminomethyltransferase family protein n=1 Tax=Leisingera daeponensis TaxID=405746 RepID=A0ABS7NDZ6_9RHOB|nr:aminomethyltransferase family protein [Leisingera daeponensis]MBY6139441.1 aminomethyltransferase family protein [Leisingera daeponensis]
MTCYGVLHDFDNMGFQTPVRAFPGFRKAREGVARVLAPRELLKQELRAGDLLSLEGPGQGAALQIAVFDAAGRPALAALGLQPDAELAQETCDIAELLGWISVNGGDSAAGIPACTAKLTGEPLLLKAAAEVTAWICCPANREQLAFGGSAGNATVTWQPAASNTPLLPPLLGDTRDEFTVSRATAMSYEVKKGEIIQIIDVQGQQCSDFTAFNAAELQRGEEKMIDGTATRSMVRRAYPGPGLLDKFFDRDMRPLLNVVQDTCGRHDTFGLACTARGYEERGFPGHVNCSDNISESLSRFGIARRSAWPAINFFWNTWVDPHSHHIMTEESHSRPGDYVAMRALEDLVCVSTACPDDIDPINGWNPTDVHVRIYRPETPLRRAVAYREKEDAPMSISQNSAFHERLEPLTQHFAPARDLWAPVSFPSHGTTGEYWACRNAVTVQDMSGLRKYDIAGPDAEVLLQRATTRNVAKLAVWRGSYTLMCDEAGTVIDDGTLFRLAPDLFRWCCGSEESGRVLETLAQEMGLQVRIHDMRGAMPNLAIQGPKSRDLLRKITFTQPHVPQLDQLKWFGVTVARLNDREGAPFMLSRSGYTGELGYEIFCSKADALAIWDAVMAAGEEFGITPMGSAALNIIRIEAGLAAANAEFAPGVDAFEAGLGFAVDLSKPSFTGKAALERNAREPRRVLKGLLLGCYDVPLHGSPVYQGERQVGVVTSATRSPSLEHAIAIARLGVEHAGNGARLEIGQLDGRMKRLGATVTDIPFIDPQRKRARA